MTKTVQTSFFFWGDRKYVQGAHVAGGFLRALEELEIGEPEHYTVYYHRPVHRQGRIVRYTDKASIAADKENLNAEMHTEVGGEAVYLGLVGDGDQVVERRPDTEGAIVSNAIVESEKKTAYMSILDAVPLELMIVALNKHLLKAELAVDGYSPWIVGRLKVQDRAKAVAGGELSMQLLSVIANTMTRSRFHFDGKASGEIQFIRSRM